MLPTNLNSTKIESSLVISIVSSVVIHTFILAGLYIFGTTNRDVSVYEESKQVVMTEIIESPASTKIYDQPNLLISSNPAKESNQVKGKPNTKLDTNTSGKADLKAGKKQDTSKQPQTPKETPAQQKEREELEMRTNNMFLKKMDQAIKENWIRPANIAKDDELVVVLDMSLNRDGTIENLSVKTPSGNELFDRSALSSIYKINKFAVPDNDGAFEKYFKIITINFSN